MGKTKNMDQQRIIEIFIYTIPTAIVGVTAYQMVKEFLKNENNRRNFLLQKELSHQSLPLRLQAYERMALFLERIHPNKLLLRVEPQNNNKNDYENLLIAHIEHEFEHNLSQQIYISEPCWKVIQTAKNTIIQNIRKINMSDKIDSAHKLREAILQELLENTSPSGLALSYLNEEVKTLFA